MVRASGDLLHQDTCHEPEGTESIQRNTGEQSEQDRTIACVMVDLLAPRTGVEELRRIRTLFESPVRLIAFGSHVDVERLREARSAGFDEVLPRSEFTRRLVSLLQGA
jgi:DNA-binding NarL/FixJ family response regulator